jgi:hypothetical protein
MAKKRFSVRARISTENPGAVKPILDRWIPGGLVTPSGDGNGFLLEGEMEGTSARDLNRTLLSALRSVEKKTRLRSEWTRRDTTERFFDYVPTGKRTISPRPPPSTRLPSS